MAKRKITLNGAFRGQRVTGQQRYAIEMAERLGQLLPDLREVRLRSSRSNNRIAQWAELQTRLPLAARGSLLLSLTSRSPALHRHQVPVVHDLFVLDHPEWFSPAYVSLHRFVLEHQLKHALAFVAVSEEVRRQIAERIQDDREISVAPNAPSARVQAAQLSEGVSRKVGIVGKPGFLLTVGSLEPRKNLPRLISAFRRLPDELREGYPLVIVGDKGKAFASSTVRSDSRDIRLTGYIPDEELGMLYGAATAYVSVSLAEGFGIPVVEAMACGCPLVLSDIPAYRWIAGDHAAYVQPESMEDIEMALVQSVQSPAMASPAQPLHSRFNWDSSAQQVAALLDRTATAALSPPSRF